jgi:hypothetical protein
MANTCKASIPARERKKTKREGREASLPLRQLTGDERKWGANSDDSKNAVFFSCLLLFTAAMVEPYSMAQFSTVLSYLNQAESLTLFN